MKKFCFSFLLQGPSSVHCSMNYTSLLTNLLGTYTDCNMTASDHKNTEMVKSAQKFYIYFTPFILSVGIIGNSLSLTVFMSRSMRRLSASHYLAALSLADITALIFYVCVDWLKRGLSLWPRGEYIHLLHMEGFCQIFMYLGYVSRFLSAWIVVAFTVERYIAVCHPFRRHQNCTIGSAKRILLFVILSSLVFNIYKPVLSGIHETSKGGPRICTANPDHNIISFVLDNVFAFFITLVPFVIITILNCLIIRCLYRRNKKRKRDALITEENVIRLEFTLILLVISFFFIALNLPFFVVWCVQFSHATLISNIDAAERASVDFDFLKGLLYITRTIFYINYCVNFFLYSFTGAYFRREVKMLFSRKRSLLKRNSSYVMQNRFKSPTRSLQSSWV